MPFELSEELRGKIEKLISRYPTKEAAIIPAVHLLRREIKEITDEAIETLAPIFDTTAIKIKGVVTFYPMFQLRAFGKHIIQVCSTLSCSLMGSKHIVEYLERKLKIKVGETTTDKRFTLLKSECLASCGTAPMMQVNERYYENLTEEKIDKILSELN